MVETNNISTIFQSLQEDLSEIGISDPVYIRIIASRLLIERLGERDANYWWDSQVLGEFGHDALAEAVPRTTTQVQIKLATKTARKVERENIQNQSVSLFDLGPYVESQIEHELEQMNDETDLTTLENYSNKTTNEGWTDPIVSETGSVTSKPDTVIELGTVAMDDIKNKEVLSDVIDQLVHGYGESTANNLQVPYFRVNQ